MPPKVTDAVRNRIATVLFVAQSFFSASFIAGFTLSPIIAVALSGSEASAGFPNTLGLLGRAAFAYPFGLLMDRLGRRISLASGYGMAIFGALVSLWAVINNSYAAFLAGALLLGMSRAAGDQSRYVAAEVYPQSRRANIIGIMVFAGTVGAIFGPQLVVPSGRLMELFGLEGQIATNSGPFFISAVFLLFGALTIFFMLRPDPLEIGKLVALEEAREHADSIENDSTVRSLGDIFAAPKVRMAITSMVMGYFVMTFLMVITPLHMSQHDHAPGAIANVIMGHTLGMFGLSWLTGRLISRFGRIPMIYTGSAILIAAGIIAPISTQVIPLAIALFLLGLGWNFAFVSGSSLLSDALRTHERARGQSIGEVLVAISSGVASFSVGTIFLFGDYLLVGSIVVTLAFVLAIAIYFFNRQDQQLKPKAFGAMAD